MEGVKSGNFDAGLIIHEGRFIYRDHGLKLIIDLGEWWESRTSLPIPLGCITANNNTLREEEQHELETIIKSSLQYAINNRKASEEFIRQHAQELDGKTINDHINLYVNRFTVNLGREGHEAIKKLENMAIEKKIIK